ncbi:MAG: histidine--tRNA ligase, partial [Longimicrobiales bacterium]
PRFARMPSIRSLPGFRDFYPAELAVRTHITSAWRETSRRYGFEEYDGPPLESLDLYIEKSGEEIVAQLYAFEDKGGRAVALRPEMTPSLARMVGARAAGLRKPIRWFSVPQLFRYERTQRGRLREHFQWNVDIIGEPDIAADAEALAVALDGLALLGLSANEVVARYNDRRLLDKLLLDAGVSDERLSEAFAAIDKLGRDPDARIRDRLRDAGLEDSGIDRVLRVFATGSGFRVPGGLPTRSDPSASPTSVGLAALGSGLSAATELEREYGGVPGVREDLERLACYHEHLARLGFGEHIAFDPAIVRGLAYYTGTVFEIFDRQGELRAICGGGRYDDLLGSVSGAQLPAVGFGMGDVVIAELLQQRGLLPAATPHVEYYVAAMNASEALERRIAARLRASGASVIYPLSRASLKRQFKDAHARGARHTVILGANELAAGIALVREMSTGAERQVPLTDLAGPDAVAADGPREPRSGTS